MLKFFYAVGSCSLASHIALEEAGAAYEAVRLVLANGDQRKPDYLALNPKGRVPALATERGVLTENPAILAYVAQAFPQARLAPLDDPFAFGQVQAFNSYLCSTVHVARAHKARGSRWADDPVALEDMKRKAPIVFAECFELIESSMIAGPWVMGQDYSICDPYLFCMSRWLEADGGDLTRLPKVREHGRRMNERPAVRKVLAALEA